MYGTVIQQGRFTADGSAKTLAIRSDVDWMYVYNETILNDGGLTTDSGAWFYWQRGMTDGRGVEFRKLGTVANDPMTTVQIAANAGFFLVDSSANPVGAAVAQTAITNTTTPVVSTTNTGSLATGSIVRLQSDTNLPNFMGFDYEVGTVVANTSFAMRYTMANAPGAAGAGDGTYRHIKFNPIYYPRNRYIINATAAASAVITFSVTHGYTVGQEIRFTVPPEFGMVELDGLKGTVTAVNTGTNTATVDIDSSAFTAFTFPGTTDAPFNWAQAVPFGMDTAQALSSGVDILADATQNQALIGMTLAAGANSPAGVTADVIYWTAGKSLAIDNT